MADDPIFDPWALDEESQPRRRGSRWRSATDAARGLPLVTPTSGTVRRPSPPPLTERAFPVRPSRTTSTEVAPISIEELGPEDMALAPAIFTARPLPSAEPVSVDDLRPEDIADVEGSPAPHADWSDPAEPVSIDSLSPHVTEGADFTKAADLTEAADLAEVADFTEALDFTEVADFTESADFTEVADVPAAPESDEPFRLESSPPTGDNTYEESSGKSSAEPARPVASWSFHESLAADTGWSDPRPRASSARAPAGIEAAVASLEALLTPRVERVSQRLRLSRHDTYVDDRLDQRPPSLRLDLRRWVAPFQRPDEGGGAIFEIVLEGVAGDTVTGRYWLDRRSLFPSAQRSIASDGLTPGWIDELLLEFVEKALTH